MRRTAPSPRPGVPTGGSPPPGRVTRSVLQRLGYRFRLRPGPTADDEQIVLRHYRTAIRVRPAGSPPDAAPPPPGWRNLVVDPAEERDPVGLAARLDFELRAGLDPRDPAAPDYLATR